MVPEPLRLDSNGSRPDLLETKKPDISIYSTKPNPRGCYSITFLLRKPRLRGFG